jgi:hypothetical protein
LLSQPESSGKVILPLGGSALSQSTKVDALKTICYTELMNVFLEERREYTVHEVGRPHVP